MMSAEAALVCWCLIRMSGYLTSIAPANSTVQLSGGFNGMSPDRAVRLPGIQVAPESLLGLGTIQVPFPDIPWVHASWITIPAMAALELGMSVVWLRPRQCQAVLCSAQASSWVANHACPWLCSSSIV